MKDKGLRITLLSLSVFDGFQFEEIIGAIRELPHQPTIQIDSDGYTMEYTMEQLRELMEWPVRILLQKSTTSNP